MQLTLYHFNNSVCSEKVRLTLFEKGVRDWTSIELDIFKGEHFDPDYLKLNPKAVVPTLIDDNGVLTESTLIAEYIDDQFPGPKLKPDSPFERAQMRIYPKACDEGLHQGVGVFSYAGMFINRLRKLPEEAALKHLSSVIDLDRRDRQISVYEKGAQAPAVYRGAAAYEKIFAKLDKVLTDGRSWLMGDLFTLAEINLAPYFARLEYMELLDIWTRDRPRVIEWFRRIQARPSYKAEVIDWIREEEWGEMRAGGRRIKTQIAQYRDHYLQTDFGAPFY